MVVTRSLLDNQNKERNMGGIVMRRFGVVLLMAVLASCDSSNEEASPYDCAKDSIPDDAQCFEFQGQKRAFRFAEAGVVGIWNSDEYETCIQYGADGSGVFRYWGITGGVPREDSAIRWGVWIDADGSPVLTNTGESILVHHLVAGPVLDRRLVGISYRETTGFGGDFESTDACPENAESNQGVITFFSTNAESDEITVALDSFEVGELGEYIAGTEPNCGARTSKSILTLYRQPGTYKFQALSSVAVWGPIAIEVKKGECSSHALR